MERKEFLKKAGALCGLAMVPVALLESCGKQNYAAPANVNFTLDLTSSANTGLTHVGGSMVVSGVLVMRTGTSTFEALSATCTHAGCTVGYNASAGQVVCPCHGGTFNATTGAVISGPPPSALAKYTATLAGSILTVKS